jgi:hypothetical protein
VILPCPCCGQPTDSPGVRLNAIASARAAVFDATERLRKVPGNQLEKLARAKAELEEAKLRLAELEVPRYRVEEER